MKVFISWSGERSKSIATELTGWLKMVIQNVEPWMSNDIDPGSRWAGELADALRDAKFAILCLVPENLANPWVLFEGGAVSGAIGKPLVCPYLFGMDYADLSYPLAQFQAKKA